LISLVDHTLTCVLLFPSRILHSIFYYILWKTRNATNDCPELEFRPLKTEAALEEAFTGSEDIGIQGIMRGCIGVIDGWLCPIQVPPTSLVGNVWTCFLGHHQHHGFNVEGIVGHLRRFLSMLQE
jgi:hypothetical protein